MSHINDKQIWGKYCENELAAVLPILKQLGFSIKKKQPHLIGERYLMQAVTTISGKKLTLLGHRIKDNKKVIIKATSDPNGLKEIRHERMLRQAIQKINFAYKFFFSPQEILFTKKNGFTIFIQVFLENERPFLERPFKKQFFLALKAFKAQEGAHATAYKHRHFIKKTFGSKEAKDYLKTFKKFRQGIKEGLPKQKKIQALFKKAQSFLEKNTETIEQYSGFLTHTDFVPHNLRVKENKIYLLDHSSIRFGNKYEGWARFLNFMALHNSKLEQTLVEYVKNNRTEEESLSLQLMRIYRLGEIIFYYTNTLPKSSGDLLKLNRSRVIFWSQMLQAILNKTVLPKEIIQEYIQKRDLLRDKEEKIRQIGLH